MLGSILSEPAIDGAAITPIDREPIPERFQLSLWVVDILILLHDGHESLGNMEDGEVLTQGQKRLRTTTLFGRRW